MTDGGPNPPIMAASDATPIRLLIAALGGEGGGVLAGWITDAAVASGLVVSRTSIPGVAQRTGATTYYIEMIAPVAGKPRPVLALNPAPGQVDVLIASEMLEATRLAAAGMIAPTTTLIANTSRVFTMDEKMAMGDGRIAPERLRGVLEPLAKRAMFCDLTEVATRAKAPLSSVLLGALAGAKVLPLSDDALRAAIRTGGRSVDANLAGFSAGVAAVAQAGTTASNGAEGKASAAATIPVVPEFDGAAGALVAHGVARLVDYQDKAYADRYLAQLRRFSKLPGIDAASLAELARHLAVRMSVEDVIRVAQLKLRTTRVERVAAEARARPGDIVDIVEFMKPGTEEILGLLPPSLGRGLLRAAHRMGWSNAAMPLKVTTTRAAGFLRLKFLASLRRWRPHTLKFSEEQVWLARWLGLVEKAAALDTDAAREVITTAKLVRGYGDTYKRGLANWDRIATALVEPPLATGQAPPGWADQILQARLAAEKDPDGKALTATLGAIGRSTAAQSRVPVLHAPATEAAK